MASSASGDQCKMNQIARCDWLPQRARCIPQEKFQRKPYNISFIDQVCRSVKITRYWPPSFMALDSPSPRSINTQELGQYPAILTSHLVNNPYIPPKIYIAMLLVALTLCLLELFAKNAFPGHFVDFQAG